MLCEEREFNLAIKHYKQALSLRPRFAEASANLAFALIEVGYIGEAKVHCEDALAIKPDYREAHWNYNTILRRLGESSAARAHTWRRAKDHARECGQDLLVGHPLRCSSPQGATKFGGVDRISVCTVDACL